MATTARTTLPVKSVDWKTSSLLKINAKSGALSLHFYNLPEKATDGSIKAGSAFNVRCYETDTPAGAVGSGTAVIASFVVNPGGQVAKNIIVTNGKHLRIECQGVGADFKGASGTLDVMHNGSFFMGQADIEIHGGKAGAGFFGASVAQVGIDTSAPVDWPETASGI
jgi:hypothetical protein